MPGHGDVGNEVGDVRRGFGNQGLSALHFGLADVRIAQLEGDGADDLREGCH